MPDTLLTAIDPGLRGCGFALFQNDRLAQAYYVPSRNLASRGPVAWADMAQVLNHFPLAWSHLVIEYPQVYARGKSKGDPADLIEIAGVVGAISSLGFRSVRGYLPREWKGQVPKEIHHKRVLEELTADEKLNIKATPSRLLHNVYDAIALGLFELGRLGGGAK